MFVNNEHKLNVYPEPYHWTLKGICKEQYERPLELIRPFLASNSSVLDIGCGDGRHTFLLSSRCLRIVGMDNQSLPLKFARQLTLNTIPFVCGDARHLPFGNCVFDVITLFDVIEHIPFSAQDSVFREIGRALKTGGLLVLTTPNRRNLAARIFGHEVNPKHYFEYSEGELKEKLEDSGTLEVVALRGIYLPLLPRGWGLYKLFVFRPLIRLLLRMGKYFPSLSLSIMLVAKKKS